MKNVIQILSGVLALLVVVNSGCKKDPVTAEENITTIIVHLTGVGFDREFTWNDTDGDGVANVIDTIVIPAGTDNLTAHLHVYDRSVTPELDLSEEIEGENTAHLFVYNALPADLVSISGLNTDANNAPFGIESIWQTGAAKTGMVNIKLYHEPTNKTNPADPGGEVDFDVTFPVKVE